MTDKAFFLFPGQGAQFQGMALDFLAASLNGGGERVKTLFALASEKTGKDMADLLKNSDAEFLKRTDISQPAITLANLAAAAYLAEKGIEPSGAAGFSLGEYAALCAAGVISEADCFTLVTARGKAMQAAIDRIGSGADAPGMAAVVGLAPEKVEALVAEWKGNPVLKDLYAANINSPRQIVVAGTAKALAEAEALFSAAGARRFIRLQVAGPFHSPFMAEAAEEFRPFLEKTTFNDPRLPLYSNFSGRRVSSGAEAKSLALSQITGAVRWIDEEAAIAADMGGVKACLEAGPGKVLQGLWKDSGSAIPCLAAGNIEDISKAIEAFQN